MISLDSKIAYCSEVLSRPVEGEAVMVDLRDGTYFGLNEVGSRIWELIGERDGDVREILAAILNEYRVEPGEAERALLELLGELAEKGLVEASSPGA